MIRFLTAWVRAALIAAAMAAAVPTITSAQTSEPVMESAPAADKAATGNADSTPDEQSMDANVSTAIDPTAKPTVPAAVEAELQHRFNEFERRFNERQQELSDDRAAYIDRWLFVVAIVLTFFSIAIPIAAFIASVFGFKKFEEFKTKAQRYLEEIERNRDKSDEIIQGMDAETAADDPTKAKQVVEDIRGNPQASSIDKAIAEAVSLQDQGEVEEAIKIWQGIADAFEEVDIELAARARFSVGYLLSQQGKLEDAIAAYDEAIRRKPDLVEAYNNRGAAKGTLGRYEAAIADFDETIRRKPGYAEAYRNRGTAKDDLGRYEAAIADFDEAIRRKPDYAEAYFNRGNAKSKPGQHEDAITDFDEAIRRKPDYAKAYFNRGNAKSKLGRIDEARQDFEKARDLARKTGDASLVALVEQRLRELDNREGE